MYEEWSLRNGLLHVRFTPEARWRVANPQECGRYIKSLQDQLLRSQLMLVKEPTR